MPPFSEIHYLQSTADSFCKIAVRKLLPTAQPKVVVLILHGATMPSIVFDLPGWHDQPTMMSYLADKGHAVYSLDYRGYGLSSKPNAMDDPEMSGPHLITHKDAANDVRDVQRYIVQQHPGVPIILCGFSWGSAIGGYIATHNDWIAKLILLGPVYSYKNPQWVELADPHNPENFNPSIKSYRIISRERWSSLWNYELGKSVAWRDPKTLNALLDHIEATDSVWAKQTQNLRCIRVPTGVQLDAFQAYSQKPFYDASKIKCPTLVLRGQQDTASLGVDVDGLMSKLTCQKQRVEIPDATHYGILEQGAERFFQVISNFIDDYN